MGRWGSHGGEGEKTPPNTALLARAHRQGRTGAGSGVAQSGVPRPLPGETPAASPRLHLLGRLGVKVRLQKRDGELDFRDCGLGGGGGCGRAGGGLGAGAGALPSAPLRPGPSPARSAPGSRAQRWSRLSRPRGLRRRRLAGRRPSRPPSASPPGALTPSWPRRRLPGSPPRRRARRCGPARVAVDVARAGNPEF